MKLAINMNVSVDGVVQGLGGPGSSGNYPPHFYLASVPDSDGNNIEAIFHGGERS